MPISFYKYHGLGNDFVLVDRKADDLPPDPEAWAEKICRRRHGVGGDGVLFILPPGSREAHASMRIFNADGSEAEMCGNGLRCFAKHLVDHLEMQRDLVVDTGAGPLRCHVETAERGAPTSTVTVDMGRPETAPESIPVKRDAPLVGEGLPDVDPTLRFTGVSMGNPHIVCFLDDSNTRNESQEPTSLEVIQTALHKGPGLETHPIFPNKTNVSFVRRRPDGEWDAAVWERGVGLTAACGTGACAIGVAACLEGRASLEQTQPIHLPGGLLKVTVKNGYEGVDMEGPARFAFKGELRLEDLPETVPRSLPETPR